MDYKQFSNISDVYISISISIYPVDIFDIDPSDIWNPYWRSISNIIPDLPSTLTQDVAKFYLQHIGKYICELIMNKGYGEDRDTVEDKFWISDTFTWSRNSREVESLSFGFIKNILLNLFPFSSTL